MNWKKVTAGILVISLLVLIYPRSTKAAFTYYSAVTVNAAQVPSAQTDFPMLINYTDARFKTTPTGHVANANGYDIRPYTDSGCSSAITGYELEYYNASTGQVVMWVKIPSIDTGSTVYLCYGDPGISTDGSSSATWDANFEGVYHLKDGSTLSLSDSTSNANNGTNHNTVTAGTGQIDGGASFVNASSQYLTVGNAINPIALTYSAWVKADSFAESYNSIISRRGANVTQLLVKSNGKLAIFLDNAVSYDGSGSNTLSTDTWYYVTITYDSTNGLVGYVNAGVDGTSGANGDLSTTAITTDIGADLEAFRFWDGIINKVRISDIARAPDWIATEYNNQSAPSTFATLGAENAIGGVSVSPQHTFVMTGAKFVLIGGKFIFQ